MVVQSVKNYAEANGLDIVYDEVNKQFVAVERGNISTLPGFVRIEEKGSLLLV